MKECENRNCKNKFEYNYELSYPMYLKSENYNKILINHIMNL